MSRSTPLSPGGGDYYANVNTDLNTSALWPALAEKAYAEANASVM